MPTQILICTHWSVLLLAGTRHQTKESPWHSTGDRTCWAPRSSCLVHSVSKPCSVNLGDPFHTVGWMVAQEKPEDQDPSVEPSSSQVSHLCAQLFPAGCAHGHSALEHAPARQFQLYSAFLVEPRHAKQKLSFSVTCSPWPHLFLLLFPTAGAPWRWAEILTITITISWAALEFYLPSKTHFLKQKTLATTAPPLSQALYS